MGYEYRLIAPMINKALVLRQEMLKAYAAAGINLRQVIVQSVKFNMSLAKTQFALKAIYTSVGARFFPLLTKQMDLFRKNIYANMPKIQATLERFIKLIFSAFEAVTILGTRVWSILSRVYDFFLSLDKATDGWSSIVIGLIAAWKLLNLSFLATPLGMILTGLLAILALYDDFKTFQEGGKSLFNWGPVIPFIHGVSDAIDGMVSAYKSLVDIILNVSLAIWQLLKGDNRGALDSLKELGSNLVNVFSKLWDIFKGIGGAIGDVGSAAGNAVKGLFGGETGLADGALHGAIALNPAKHGGLSQPLGASNISNSSQVNQNVSQQTNISVTGATDAHATGQAIAGQQNAVNMNLTRNFSPAAR